MKIIQQAIPTNIITGFLGVGKTTAIQSLLLQKPKDERWAILINEFGEVGVDGSLVAAAARDNGELFIREVPGGCMCCAAGIPMRVALNQLISKARPDRLLIEPTGLGHPKEVIKSLLQPEYRGIVALNAVVTLVDARKISDSRYTSHPVFQQQLEVADQIIANKRDLYLNNELDQLTRYLEEHGLGMTPLRSTTDGTLDPAWLQGTRHKPLLASSSCEALEPAIDPLLAADQTMPESGYLRKIREQGGYCSGGWVFSAEFLFDYNRIYNVLCGLEAERIKAVVLTDKGAIGFNQSDGVLTSVTVGDIFDSRVELITRQFPDWDQLENKLMDCVVASQ